jgi:hypothetical protein
MLRYIVMNCWRKMLRRLAHWSSEGFIYTLGKLDPETLREHCKEFLEDLAANAEAESVKRLDKSLYLTIQGMNGRKELEPVLSAYRSLPVDFKVVDNVENLIKALAYNNPAESRNPGHQWRNPYTPETCIEFHHLYIGANIALRGALTVLKGGVDNNKRHPDGAKGLKDSLNLVFRYSWLLYKLSSCGFFATHLRMLTNRVYFLLPDLRQRNVYAAWLGHGKVEDAPAPVPPNEGASRIGGNGTGDDGGGLRRD